MVYTLKHTIIVSILIGVLLGGVFPLRTQGYFEDRLLCDIQSQTVTVLIDTQGVDDESQYCFDILQRIARKTQGLQADLTRAQGYQAESEGADATYRGQVVTDLESSLVPYETMKTLVTRAMRDYELQLFLSTKGLVRSYLQPEYEDITTRYDQALILKERIVLLGNRQQFEFVMQKIQEREQLLMVLRTIRQASSFESLMPALRTYFALQETPAL